MYVCSAEECRGMQNRISSIYSRSGLRLAGTSIGRIEYMKWVTGPKREHGIV